MSVQVIPKLGDVLVSTWFTGINTDRTMNSTTPEDFLVLKMTPKSLNNFFIIWFSWSGDAAGGDTQAVFRILEGVSGSESQNRACFAFADASDHNGGSAGIVLRVAVFGAGEHTIKVTWHRQGDANEIRCRPVGAGKDLDHSSLIVQEVTG